MKEREDEAVRGAVHLADFVVCEMGSVAIIFTALAASMNESESSNFRAQKKTKLDGKAWSS